MFYIRSISILLAFALFSSGGYAEDRYIVEFEDYNAAMMNTTMAIEGQVHVVLEDQNRVAMSLSEDRKERMLHNPYVKSIERDPKRRLFSQQLQPAELEESIPWGLSAVQADQLEDLYSSNRKVCIIDSGYFAQHDDLPVDNVTYSSGSARQDQCSHGSHVAGTIAALGEHSEVEGILPSGDIGLHIVKVFGDSCGWIYASTVIGAVNECVDAGSNVINMSLGGSNSSSAEKEAFNEVYEKGVLPVAAAGNSGNSEKSYPASYPAVVSVAALDEDLRPAEFSQYNDQVEIAAPGVDVLSTVSYEEQIEVKVGSRLFDNVRAIENAAEAKVEGKLVDGGRCLEEGSWSDKLVLCERGGVTFYEKTKNVENSGGVGVVIYNNEAGNFNGTLGFLKSSSIPAVSISRQDGERLLAEVFQKATLFNLVKKETPGYSKKSGTSMASPHVAGVAALVWSYNPDWTVNQVREALCATARNLDASMFRAGCGLVQAKDALEWLQGSR